MTSKPVLAIPAENQQHYEEEVGELVEKVQEKAAAQVDWSGERFGELTGRNKRWLTESDYERLTELNVCHSLVTIGAKVVVAYFQRGEFGRRVEFLPVRSFTDRMNGTDTIHGWIKDNKGKAKQGNPIGLGEAWLAWNRKCRHDDGVIFRPAQEVSETHLNLWQGFAVEPKLGPVGLWLAHLKQVICNGDEHLATYLKKYIAHMVQRPHIKPTVAITLFTDGKGAGKDLFIAPLLTLLGYHGAQINGLDHIVGRFNAMLEGKILISCNEARITSDEKLQKAKTVISERTVAVERKGIDAIPIRQYARLILTTNSETAIKVEKGERRQCMIHCSEEYATRRGDAVQERKRSEYFGPLGDWVDGDGPAHLLHYLLHMVDLEGFDVNDCPATATLNEAILEHLPPQDIWLIDWAANVKAHSSSKEGLTSIPLGTLRESFNVFMAQYNMPPVTETAWRSKGGKLFTKAGILLSTDAKERKRVIKMTPEAIRKKVADYVSLPPEDVFGVDTP